MGREHRFLEGVEEEKDAAILSAFLVRYYVPGRGSRAAARAPVPAGGLGCAARAAAGRRVDCSRSGARRTGGSSWPTRTRGTCWRASASSRSRPRSAPRIRSTRWAATSGSASVPRSLVCVDISHNQGKDTVGSLVWFEAGRPRKSEYRKFKIQGSGPAGRFRRDPGSAHPVPHPPARRAAPLPDLIVIDGGKGQLSAALRGGGSGWASPDSSSPASPSGRRRSSCPDGPRALRLAAPQPVAAAAPAGPGRGAPLRPGLQPEAAHAAHDHLRAAQHPRRRPTTPPTAAGALRQSRGCEVRLGVGARDRAGILHPPGGAGARAPSDPRLSLPELPDVVVYLEALEPRVLGASPERGAAPRVRSCSAPWTRRSPRCATVGCSPSVGWASGSCSASRTSSSSSFT